jgi:hypothetical protein
MERLQKTIPIAVDRSAKTTRRPPSIPPRTPLTAEPYRAYKPQPFRREERDHVTILFGAIRLSSYECGMDQPTSSPVQQIVERSGTLYFSLQGLDSTKPAGSVKIRVETIAHYLQKYSQQIIARKKAAAPGGCPLLGSFRLGVRARVAPARTR